MARRNFMDMEMKKPSYDCVRLCELRNSVGEKAFYSALRKLGFKTLAEVPIGQEAVVLKGLQEALGGF